MDRRMQWALRRLQSLEERVSRMETATGSYNSKSSLFAVKCEMLNGHYQSQVHQGQPHYHSRVSECSCSCDDESTSDLDCVSTITVCHATLLQDLVQGSLVSILCCLYVRPASAILLIGIFCSCIPAQLAVR